jgi:flagellar biosynthesis protein FlhG
MTPAGNNNRRPLVLPVGGGKGGIGKSALTANLGLTLARLDYKVTVVDADLGGSDLHNLLAQDNERPGLGEVLTNKELTVAQVWQPVLEQGLHFIPGDAMIVGTANPSFQKKRKLLHDLKALPGDFILLDLGAGTAITVMDFFLTSPFSLVVMLPERPAVLSAYNFLKNVLFRALDRIFRDNARTKSVLAEYQSRGKGPGSMAIDDLIAALDAALPGSGVRARRAIERWRPKLVLNRVRTIDDFVYARNLQTRVLEDLGLLVEVLGFLPEDELVHTAAQENRLALDMDPRALFCQAVTRLALQLSPWAGRAKQWLEHRAFDDSFERAATDFSIYFPPPGERIPTRAELLERLRELEGKRGI